VSRGLGDVYKRQEFTRISKVFLCLSSAKKDGLSSS
jgi:hypothetical protein